MKGASANRDNVATLEAIRNFVRLIFIKLSAKVLDDFIGNRGCLRSKRNNRAYPLCSAHCLGLKIPLETRKHIARKQSFLEPNCPTPGCLADAELRIKHLDVERPAKVR